MVAMTQHAPSLEVVAFAAFVPSSVFSVVVLTVLFSVLHRRQRLLDKKIRAAGGNPDVGYLGTIAALQRRQRRRRRGPIGWVAAWFVRWSRARSERLGRGKRLKVTQTSLFAACVWVFAMEACVIAPVFVLRQLVRG